MHVGSLCYVFSSKFNTTYMWREAGSLETTGLKTFFVCFPAMEDDQKICWVERSTRLGQYIELLV